MASVVGNTGVGKSTIASFISGNMSMFTSKSNGVGTTTVGADLSPIIPSADYLITLQEKLQEGETSFTPDLYEPEIERPLFLIDSEGMSFRGDAFDFITSGPAAIIAKSIIWITTDRLRPAEILQDVREISSRLGSYQYGRGI
eukprot:TRINITY_DN12009_c0_g1_i1.p1 TRINITY_DN12009_c0_g1~~TRINITY_DN12009_c0_g1_i1.p1  ORF type:complete len:159 (-),score=21.55 TRINITY_DN12009_c0_g1_i1:29-457(-)